MRSRSGAHKEGALQPTRWSGRSVLPAAHRLNKQCFGLFARAAGDGRASTAYPAVYASRELWRRVDDRACERAARCPILLLDLNFQRRDWWRQAGTGSAQRPPTAEAGLPFRAELLAPLMRELVMEAWITARSKPLAAALLFGMAPAVVSEVANLSLPEVDRVVAEQVPALRPRWHDSRLFWAQLLEGAIGMDDQVLMGAWLHGLQLLGKDIAPQYA